MSKCKLFLVKAIYQKTHPEYALYLYLMAPISLSILNPVAFVLMEINKQREAATAITNEEERKKSLSKIKLLKQIFNGIAFNPVMAMTILGIAGNIIFKHDLTVYIEGLLEVCNFFNYKINNLSLKFYLPYPLVTDNNYFHTLFRLDLTHKE